MNIAIAGGIYQKLVAPEAEVLRALSRLRLAAAAAMLCPVCTPDTSKGFVLA